VFGYLAGSLNQKEWNLEAVVMLADANLNPINSTVSVTPFTITVYNMANVQINVPKSVDLTLDGTPEPGGFNISLRVGSNHTLVVPQVIPINAMSRIVLSPGWVLPWSYYNNRTNLSNNASPLTFPISVWGDANLTINYVTQYNVTVTSNPFNATITPCREWKLQWVSTWSGWCDESATLSLSTVTSPQPLPGLLGQLGRREVFDGWYVNGQYFNNTWWVNVPVSGPLTIEARWHADYSVPIIIASAFALAAGALCYVGVGRSWRKLKWLAHEFQSTISVGLSSLDSRLSRSYRKWMACLLILYVIIPDIYQAGPWAEAGPWWVWSGLSWFAFGWEYNAPWAVPIQIALQNFSCLFSNNPSCLYVMAESSLQIWEVMFNGLLFGVLVTVVPLVLIVLVMYKAKVSSRRAFCCLVLGVLLSIIHVYGLYLGWSFDPKALSFPYVPYNPLWHLYGLIIPYAASFPFPLYVPLHTIFIIPFTLLAYRNWSSISQRRIQQSLSE